MSTKTNIQWTDVTDNIIRVVGGGWWCRKISDGCANCYAALLNQNAFYGGNKLAYTGEPPKLELQRDILASWARQTKSKKHFVASMTDVFGDWVPVEWQFEMLDAMAAAPKQTFQVLTKRADIMRKNVLAWLEARGLKEVPRNIWLGVSAENQKCYDARVQELIKIPSVRFISMEPLLSFVDTKLVMDGAEGPHEESFPAPTQYGQMIDWIIIGGESGIDCRYCETSWIRYIVNECKHAGVACFVKQLGRYPEWTEAEVDQGWYKLFSDPKGGNWEQWPDYLRIRQFPEISVPSVSPC
jgi:protein gp37